MTPIGPNGQNPASVHDLVVDLHEKQKSFDVHEQTMRQVALREATLKKEFEAITNTFEDRIALLE